MTRHAIVLLLCGFVVASASAWQASGRERRGTVAERLESGNSDCKPIGTGQWGGRHVGMIVTATGATLEWDCAHGTVDHAIVLGPNGRFDVTGVHVREHGGPVRQGEAEDSHPARYTGTVVDDTMTLTVVLTDTNESLGTFTLVRGAAPQVFKCG